MSFQDPKLAKAIDTGLSCLVMIARFHQVAADANQIAHHFAKHDNNFNNQDIVRAAKHLKLRAKSVSITLDQLEKVALPAIASDKQGNYFILAKASFEGDVVRFLIQVPGEKSPTTLNREELASYWSGELILVTKRTLLPGVSGKFDISWFIPAILKYKKILIQVLVASFFIQLFALITPLFFQVVIDKVLVHQGLTTLDVRELPAAKLAQEKLNLSGSYSPQLATRIFIKNLDSALNSWQATRHERHYHQTTRA